jgi:hypothetical protein
LIDYLPPVGCVGHHRLHHHHAAFRAGGVFCRHGAVQVPYHAVDTGSDKHVASRDAVRAAWHHNGATARVGPGSPQVRTIRACNTGC